MASNATTDVNVGQATQPAKPEIIAVEEKGPVSTEKQIEIVDASEHNLRYDNSEEEPELHFRTYIAILAMCISNMVQCVALQGPPAVVRIQLTNISFLPSLRYLTNHHSSRFIARLYWRQPTQPANTDLGS